MIGDTSPYEAAMKINLIEYFEATVEAYPEKIALIDENTSLTFQELRSRSKVYAHAILKNKDVVKKPIAVYLPKSVEAVSAFLAILYSGNSYAPLDIGSPVKRIQQLLEVLKPEYIITDSDCIDKLESLNLGIELINIDRIESNPAPDIKSYGNCIDTDPAYIMHTSGSTGVPKGVVISHKSIIDFIHWVIETFKVTSEEKISNQAPFVFDNSTLDIYLMVFTGATLHLTPEHFFIFPKKLIDYLEANQISFIFWVPSVLVQVANMGVLRKDSLPSLKKVLFCGEIMPTKHLNIWRSNLSRSTLYANLYGPTEITDVCTYHIIERDYPDQEPLPIGKACRNTEILLLNNENKLCSIDEHGELCIRGSCLSPGYWKNQDKTAEAFVQNPHNTAYLDLIYRTGDIAYQNSNGNIMFVGRKDLQIKHLGYRIELGEIEHAVLSSFDNLSACVVYDEVRKEIILFYQSLNTIEVPDFRIKLSKVIPKYMVPTKYIQLDELPKNASGKIDRNYLNKYNNI